MPVTLKNGALTVTVSELGAEIRSVLRDGTEQMWCADPKIWGQSAPIMFPICGGLKDGRYELDGATYEMPKHGFARKSIFELEHRDAERAVLVLRDSEETRRYYPYAFEFRAVFELDGESLKVTYIVENKDNKVIYCSVGSHEAYACPEGIEAYDIVFPQRETLRAYALNGELLTDYTKLILDDSRVLPLRSEYFYLDALVFRDLKSRSAELIDRASGRRVRVEFDGADYFLLWQKYGAPYICIEPWSGVQDVAGSSYDITKKEGVNAVPVGGSLIRSHTITFDRVK